LLVNSGWWLRRVRRRCPLNLCDESLRPRPERQAIEDGIAFDVELRTLDVSTRDGKDVGQFGNGRVGPNAMDQTLRV
jgi:hypothetical protein